MKLREALDLNVSEKEFQAAVVQLARLRGWLVYHTFDARRSEPGFPDLVCARNGRVVFAELKREGGSLSRAQQRWQDALGSHEVYVWRPSDWADVERVLR